MTTDPNKKDTRKGGSCRREAESWEAVATAARTGEPIDESTAGHIEQCASCRGVADQAKRLDPLMSALSDQIRADASRPESSLRGERTAELLVRLVTYEEWRRTARRACAASVGIAASLVLLYAVTVGFADREDLSSRRPSLVNPAASLVDDVDKARMREDPLNSAVASAIPVHGWVDLPSRGTSADSSMWWVVLSYGGSR